MKTEALCARRQLKTYLPTAQLRISLENSQAFGGGGPADARYTLQLGVRFPTQNDQLVLTSRKVEKHRYELIIQIRSIPPPTHQTVFKTGRLNKVPDHCRGLRLGINVQKERISA